MPSLKLSTLHLLLLGLAASAHAQTSITLDGSLPNGLTGPIAPLSPGVYEIPETVGEPRGDNLFHSLGDFDIGVGERATFTAQAEYERVIARVTGGEPSRIDGRLASTVMADAIRGADLYLLNPWGLLFGPNASIDVPGGLHLSTAQQLHFANDGVLDLVNKENPTLSVAEPAAFGFLGGPPPNPTLDFDIQFAAFPGSVSTLGTRPGQTLSIVGRDVAVRNRMFLTAQSGRLQVAALGESAAQVPVDVAELETRTGDPAQLGSLELSGGAQLSTIAFDPAADQGSIVIRAGRFALSGGIVRAGGPLDDSGPAVDIETAGLVSLGANSTIATVNQGAQDAGGVHIRAGSLALDGTNAVIRSQVAGSGAGGELRLEADSIALRNQAQIEARSDSLGGPAPTGAVGDVTLVAAGGEIRVESGADVITRTFTLGPGGDISIRAGQLAVVNGSVSAESGVSAPGGSIGIDVERVEVRGGLAQIDTLNGITTAPEPTLPGGDIRIGSAARPVGNVVIVDGGLVSAETSGPQPGGAIHVFADALEVTGGGIDADGDPRQSALQTATSSASDTGVGGSITLDLGSLRVGPDEPDGLPGLVRAFVAQGARGAGGAVDLEADSVVLEGGGRISTTTLGSGHAGSIDLDLTGDFVARGARLAEGFQPSGLFARGEAESAGDAGRISVSAARIELLDAAAISSRADGSGNSGDVGLFATEAIRVVGGFQASSVTARGLVGRAGNVTLAGPVVDGEPGSVGRVELRGGGIVDVSVSGAGEGGLLRVVADELIVSGESGTGIPSSLGAETAGAGAALGIEIEVSERVRVEDGGEINSKTRFGGGEPGDIRVRAATIEFVGGNGTAESEAGEAGAGSIRLEASAAIRVLDGAELTVRSASGQDAGSLALVAPDIEVRDSTLTADADAFGGSIEIETDRLVLEDSSLIALSRGGGAPTSALALGISGNTPAGGNIRIGGGAVVLNQASLVADGFGNANGGLIDITADPWLRSGDSVVSASSEFGLAGSVIVNTPNGEVTGDLAALPETFLDASSLLEEPCLAREAPSGSFAVQRGPAIRPPPDAPLSAGPGEALECSAP